MLEFARRAEAIGATASKLEKVRLLSAYLQGLDPPSLRLAATYLSGRPLAATDPRVLSLGWAAIVRAVARLAGRTDQDLSATYLRHSDLGDWTYELLAGSGPGTDVALGEVAATLSEVAEAAPAVKAEVLARLLGRLYPLSAKYLVKVLSGDLRIGLSVGLLEEAIAAAYQAPADAVRRAHMLTGDIGETALLARSGSLSGASMTVFQPIRFMLASPVADPEQAMARVGAKTAWTEEKYDGVRCQLHRDGHRVALFSRDLKETTSAFPEVVEAARAVPAVMVLDGEILGHREGRVLRFFELQRRLGRKEVSAGLRAEVPVVFVAFDLLHLDGESMLETPLRERRRRLEALDLPHPFLLARYESASGTADLDRIFQETRARGHEGLMIKDPTSAYTPGRRGLAWLKLKRPLATLDTVVTAVEWGHGKRRGVLSDYTFAVKDQETGRLVNVGKAYTGLTDREIEELTAHFLSTTLVDQGRRRLVEPDTVIEVAFDSIQRSGRHQSGFALRFPRILRVRQDKPVAEIDTLSGVEELYSRFFGGATGVALDEVAEPAGS